MRLATAAAMVLALTAASPDLSGLEYAQRPGSVMPMTVPLREASGAITTLAEMGQGRPIIVDFGYFHCPSLCSATRDDLLGALGRSGLRAGQDYQLAAISIDPAETPADAAAAFRDDLVRYQQPGAAAAWHFLTGPQASLAALQAGAGFHARWDNDLRQFLHPEGLLFLSPRGQVVGYQFGYENTTANLGRNVRLAAAGLTAPKANPVLLLCFHFNPVTGRYSLAIVKVLRLGGILTILGLAALLASGWRWRKSPTRPISG